MYLCFHHKTRELKSLTTAAAGEPYETPVSVEGTGFEMKGNAAYEVKSLRSAAAGEPYYETPVNVEGTGFEMKGNAAYGQISY